MKPVWIELVEDGVANRFELDDYELIEINWRVTMYPELYKRILDHEFGHQDGKFKLKDLKHDMFSRTPGLFTFMKNHISAWTQLMPIYYDRKRNGVVYDWSAIVSWWLLVATVLVIYFVMGWVF